MKHRVMLPQSRPAQHAGLSLIELMVTLAITAVVLGIAVPSMYDMIARRRVAAVAAELASDLRYLNSTGLQNNASSQLDIASNCYVMSLNPTGDTCDCNLPQPCGTGAMASQILKSVTVPANAGITLTFNRANTVFNWQGLLDPRRPTPLAVTVSSTNGGKVKVYTTGAIARPYACSLEHQETSFPACVSAP